MKIKCVKDKRQTHKALCKCSRKLQYSIVIMGGFRVFANIKMNLNF